jgi:hypothetical protein
MRQIKKVNFARSDSCANDSLQKPLVFQGFLPKLPALAKRELIRCNNRMRLDESRNWGAEKPGSVDSRKGASPAKSVRLIHPRAMP